MDREALFALVKANFSVDPAYLWKKFPNYAVFKHLKTNKWFGIVMDVDSSKLGLKSSERIDILNVKLRPGQIDCLDGDNILPAYHMNKKHWVSIVLNKTSEKQVTELLSASFKLTS